MSAVKVKNKPVPNKTHVASATGVTTSNDGDYSGSTEKITYVTGATLTDALTDAVDPLEKPPEDKKKIEVKYRPSYAVYDDFTNFGQAGVYYHSLSKPDKQGNQVEINEWLWDPLHIDAGSCDAGSDNFGLLLRFRNRRGVWRNWLMPLEMLSGGCEELRAELLKQGLRINHNKRTQLPNYSQSQIPPKKLECALKIGWHGDSFVLPDKVIGHRDDIFFQTDHSITADYGQFGTLEEWQSNVSRYCIGNYFLLFMASIGFTGAILKKCNINYVGFHGFGDSSTGKSTAQKIAASAWGGESFTKTWKSTGNGLEASAVLYNDCLMALDELGDSDPREALGSIYMLGNGTGKQRANAKGSARKVHRWRIALLSNGEKTLRSHAQTAGLTVKAGQEIRFLEIPVFGRHGAFDELHGMKDGRLFSDTLQANTAKYYGVAGIAYLEKLINDNQDFGELLEVALKKFIADDAMDGQEKRAARAFAVVSVAGELTSKYGITGWPEGVAEEAALKCFYEWQQHRGTGKSEDQDILKAIRDFIDGYEDTRFTSLNDSNAQCHHKRAGWYEGLDTRIYYFTAGGLSDATIGYDNKRVVEAMTKAGWLVCGKGGKPYMQQKISRINTRVYKITLLDDFLKGSTSSAETIIRATSADLGTYSGNAGSMGSTVKLDYEVNLENDEVIF